MASAYPEEIKEAAKILYIKRYTPREIKEQLNINSVRVVYQWAERYNWEALLKHETVEQAIARRIVVLAEKEDKTTDELNEIDRLIGSMEKLAKIDLIKAKAAREKVRSVEPDGDEDRPKRKRKKRVKNDISGITEDRLRAVFDELFWDYQKTWHEAKKHRTRFILKSRQIGATFYFAWEAFEDAVLTGDNQIFLSASRAQAEIFKAYIIGFAKKYFDVDLKGDPIVLSNQAELRFISTNARTAQGYHGHVYFDEVFWTPDWNKLNQVASGMAMHKNWRKTYFSTPSVKSHPAFKRWSGELFNDKRKNKVEIDISHKALKNGVLGPDKVWRHIVTVIDAEEQGCDLFDIDELREEYTKAEFDNLLMCVFLDDSQSVFDLNDLLACAVDTKEQWTDFKAENNRPFRNRAVWLGFDPSRTRDNASLAVLAPPLKPGDKFRVLERHYFKRQAFAFQANRIQDLTDRFNVEFIGVDTTGIGLGVYELVEEFFPNVTAINYSLDAKTALVLKAMDVIESGRIEWDASYTEIPQAFLQVTRSTTGGGSVTFTANRTKETGHADIAWAIMHALSNEPINRIPRTASLQLAA